MSHPSQKARWSERRRFTVPFIDLKAQHAAMADEIDEAFARVGERAWYLFGREVAAFESAFSATVEDRPVVSCASGTDALILALRALGVGPGDEVIVPAFTFAATALAVLRTGARPCFCDVNPETRCMDSTTLAPFRGRGVRALVAVHLFGHPAPMDGIMGWAKEEDVLVVEDACQGHGASWRDRPVGCWGDGAAFSFYPGKNLGGVGDGGAVVTRDEGLARDCRVLANYGIDGGRLLRGDGMNSRFSELSAAVCRAKLARLAGWNERRQELVDRYRRGLPSGVRGPVDPREGRAGWHAFVVEVDEGRDALAAAMLERGIEVRVHYGRALVDEPLFAGRVGDDGMSVSRTLARQVLSLPLYPELGEKGVDEVLRVLHQAWPLRDAR